MVNRSILVFFSVAITGVLITTVIVTAVIMTGDYNQGSEADSKIVEEPENDGLVYCQALGCLSESEPQPDPYIPPIEDKDDQGDEEYFCKLFDCDQENPNYIAGEGADEESRRVFCEVFGDCEEFSEGAPKYKNGTIQDTTGNGNQPGKQYERCRTDILEPPHWLQHFVPLSKMEFNDLDSEECHEVMAELRADAQKSIDRQFKQVDDYEGLLQSLLDLQVDRYTELVNNEGFNKWASGGSTDFENALIYADCMTRVFGHHEAGDFAEPLRTQEQMSRAISVLLKYRQELGLEAERIKLPGPPEGPSDYSMCSEETQQFGDEFADHIIESEYHIYHDQKPLIERIIDWLSTK